MDDVKVSIVRIEAMRVASAYGFGDSPEELAWRHMAAWARPRGFLSDLIGHPLYGFNNPYPTNENPRYGYELWMNVGADVEPEGNIRIGEFMGGLYAITRCEVRGDPGATIPGAWKRLAEWCRENDHPLGPHHALEHYLSSPEDLDALVVGLCCPIIA
jgi:DNA gyrase inhibitor GyrI